MFKALVVSLFEFAIVMTTPGAFAQTPDSIANVVVSVAGSDQLVVDQLTSFVSRELRNLPNIRVVTEPPDGGVVLVIQISTISTCGGYSVAAGFSFSQRYYLKYQNGTDARPYKSVYSGVIGYPRNDISGMASSIVAAFDSHGLTDYKQMLEFNRKP